MQKTIITAVAMLGLVFTSYSQERPLAKVPQVEGKDIYFYSEPVQPYDTAFPYTAIRISTSLWETAWSVVKRCDKISEKYNLPYDGIYFYRENDKTKHISIKYR